VATGTVVEFVGLPGAGKTYLATELSRRLGARGLEVTAVSRPRISAGRRAVLILVLAVRRPGFVRDTARLMRGLAKRGTPDGIRLWTNWLTAQALVEQGRHRPGFTVLDQGPFQLLWSVGMRGGAGAVADCAALVRANPTPDVLVVVSVPPELAADRLRKRHPDSADRLEEGDPDQGQDILRSVLAVPDSPVVVTVDNRHGASIDRTLGPVLAALSVAEPPL